MKNRVNNMPKATFQISGEIKDFTRVDNIYRIMKREGEKLLDDWEIKFDVTFEEKKGTGETL